MPQHPLNRRQFLAAGALALAGRGSEAAFQPPSGGTLLLAGGGSLCPSHETLARNPNLSPDELDPHHILRTMLARTGKAAPSVELITNASRQFAEETAHEYTETLKRLGAGEIHATTTRDAAALAADKTLPERLKKADIVFFTGGDQEELTRLLPCAKLAAILRQRLSADAHFVLAGSSAGSMAMPTRMIAADGREKPHIPRMEQGLGVIPAIIETHLSDATRAHRPRRLLEALAQHPAPYAIGIDSGTTLLIQGEEAQVIGSGKVLLACAPEKTQTTHRVPPASLPHCADLPETAHHTHLLPAGGRCALPGLLPAAALSR